MNHTFHAVGSIPLECYGKKLLMYDHIFPNACLLQSRMQFDKGLQSIPTGNNQPEKIK